MARLDIIRSKCVRTTSCKLVRVKKFTEMWESGLTIREIADYYQIGEHEVKELRKRLGLPPHQKFIRYILDDSDLQRITELYNSGIPIEMIADELRITPYVCSRHIGAMCLHREQIPRRKSDSVVERYMKFRELYSKGWSMKEIAEELGICKSRCYGIREELGLPLRVEKGCKR